MLAQEWGATTLVIMLLGSGAVIAALARSGNVTPSFTMKTLWVIVNSSASACCETPPAAYRARISRGECVQGVTTVASCRLARSILHQKPTHTSDGIPGVLMP